MAQRMKPTAEWLTKRYWEDSADCVEIGRELSRDPTTVRNWMVSYGIPTRPRGHNAAIDLPRGRKPGFRLTNETRDKLRRARLRDGRVPYLRDGQHWLKTAPSDQHPKWKGGITPERQRLYATEEWKAAVEVVWASADELCQRCGKAGDRNACDGSFHIHHKVSFHASVELRAEPSNLVLLCVGCHRWVHSSANVNREWIKVLSS